MCMCCGDKFGLLKKKKDFVVESTKIFQEEEPYAACWRHHCLNKKHD